MYIIRKLVKNGREINLPAFAGYSNVYCHNTCVLEVWYVSYMVIGNK